MKYKREYIPAIIGILGVISGCLVTGFFAYRTQQFQIRSLEARLYSDHAQEELLNIQKLIYSYSDLSLKCAQDAMNNQVRKENINELQCLRDQLFILANKDLGLETYYYCDKLVNFLLDSKKTNKKSKDLFDIRLKWIFAAHVEIQMYRKQTLSESWREDFNIGKLKKVAWARFLDKKTNETIILMSNKVDGADR